MLFTREDQKDNNRAYLAAIASEGIGMQIFKNNTIIDCGPKFAIGSIFSKFFYYNYWFNAEGRKDINECRP